MVQRNIFWLWVLLTMLWNMSILQSGFGQNRVTKGANEPLELYEVNKLARQLSSSKPDSTFLLSDYILNNQDIAKIPTAAAEAYMSKGLGNMAIGRWTDAEASFRNAVPLFRQLGDSLSLANAFDLLGYALVNQGYIDKQLELQMLALDYRKRFGGHPARIGRSYGALGNVYLQLGEVEQAMENYQKSLDIKRTLSGLKAQNLGFSIRNIGRAYAAQGIYDQAIQQYSEAIDSFKVDDNKQFIMNTYQLLGQAFHEKKEYLKAEMHLDTALNIAKNINSIGARGGIYLDLAKLYNAQESTKKAVWALDSARHFFFASNTMSGLKESYYMWAAILESQGAYPEALAAYQAYIELKDTLTTQESTRKLAELRTQYDIGQKEQQITLLEEKRRGDRRLSILLSLGLALAMLAAVLIFNANRRRKKAFDALKQEKEKTDQLYKDLQHTQAQLIHAEKMASLGQLTAGVAHEINNPVNFITSSVSALKMDLNDLGPLMDKLLQLDSQNTDVKQLDELVQLIKELDLPFLKEELEDLIKSIEIGAHRTQDIISALRLYSRNTTGKFQSTDVHQNIDSALLILNNKIADRVEVVKSYAEDLPPISCMSGKLSQVFVNLIDNAIHAMSGEGTLYINTAINELENKLLIKFRDTGKGMDDETMNNAFHPFYTTKEVGKGTGLGLYISYGIMEQHGGQIHINNKLEQGLEMIVELPLNAEREKV